MNKLFEIKNLSCSYDKPYREGLSRTVLQIDNLVVPKGKKIFIVGESGIGKSTILEVLGLMNNTIIPNDATSFVFYGDNQEEVDLIAMWKRNRDKELSDFRKKHFNFIFQSTNLMRNFTAYENISITRMLQGYSQKESYERAEKVLKDLDLHSIDQSRMTQELSGGQQQRLAFARAIVPEFTVLFGDEPTGNLDAENATAAMKLLTAKLEEYEGSSAVIVSHDMPLAMRFGDVIIKIKKVVRKKQTPGEDDRVSGLIDSECVFYPSEDRKSWNNGVTSYSDSEFDTFLRKRS